MWDEITCPFLNFNGCSVEVKEWICIFISDNASLLPRIENIFHINTDASLGWMLFYKNKLLQAEFDSKSTQLNQLIRIVVHDGKIAWVAITVNDICLCCIIGTNSFLSIHWLSIICILMMGALLFLFGGYRRVSVNRSIKSDCSLRGKIVGWLSFLLK